MKVKEIRDMTTEELEVKLLDLKKELFNLRFRNSNASTRLDNPLAIANVKKSIARVKTVIRERELEETV